MKHDGLAARRARQARPSDEMGGEGVIRRWRALSRSQGPPPDAQARNGTSFQ